MRLKSDRQLFQCRYCNVASHHVPKYISSRFNYSVQGGGGLKIRTYDTLLCDKIQIKNPHKWLITYPKRKFRKEGPSNKHKFPQITFPVNFLWIVFYELYFLCLGRATRLQREGFTRPAVIRWLANRRLFVPIGWIFSRCTMTGLCLSWLVCCRLTVSWLIGHWLFRCRRWGGLWPIDDGGAGRRRLHMLAQPPSQPPSRQLSLIVSVELPLTSQLWPRSI